MTHNANNECICYRWVSLVIEVVGVGSLLPRCVSRFTAIVCASLYIEFWWTSKHTVQYLHLLREDWWPFQSKPVSCPRPAQANPTATGLCTLQQRQNKNKPCPNCLGPPGTAVNLLELDVNDARPSLFWLVKRAPHVISLAV